MGLESSQICITAVLKGASTAAFILQRKYNFIKKSQPLQYFLHYMRLKSTLNLIFVLLFYLFCDKKNHVDKRARDVILTSPVCLSGPSGTIWSSFVHSRFKFCNFKPKSTRFLLSISLNFISEIGSILRRNAETFFGGN